MPELTTDFVMELVARELPQYSHLRVRPVEQQGWDNRTFRLGEELAVRIPSADAYAAGIAKEDRVLPLLADRLPVAVPEVITTVGPSTAFARRWSFRRWLPGRPPEGARPLGEDLARALGHALRALRAVTSADGPWAGAHSFLRGAHPSAYADEVQRAANQTLVRSINTSVVALLPVGAILFIGAFLLGAGTLKDISLALFIGIIAGTYSSIFLAPGFLVDLRRREPGIAAHTASVLAAREGEDGPRTSSEEDDDAGDSELTEAGAGTDSAARRRQPGRTSRNRRTTERGPR